MERDGVSPAILYIDLNGMKFYNRQFGFEGGDLLLRSFARLMIKYFGAENCSHVGQDHFAAVAAEEPLFGRVRDALPKPLSESARGFVETAVVALGVAMAFRAYFFQPFKIPTGSMQPTLYGIHSEACAEPGFFDAPVLKWAKWLATGREWIDATFHRSGRLVVDMGGDPGYVRLMVAGEIVQVPRDAFDRGEVGLWNGGQMPMADSGRQASFVADRVVRAGDCLWRGYAISGDQVFVNRMAWNFRPPERDEIVVFATGDRALAGAPEQGASNIPVPFFGLPLFVVDRTVGTEIPVRAETVPAPGGGELRIPVRDPAGALRVEHRLPAGEHYIKRLVGLPGETVSVEAPRLFADGRPVSGLPGIDRVAAMGPSDTSAGGEPVRYAGYRNTSDPALGPSATTVALLAENGDAVAVGDGYLPMGDNTRNSFDGRYWGPVPRRQMLGPACCVYWPLSVRWGRVR